MMMLFFKSDRFYFIRTKYFNAFYSFSTFHLRVETVEDTHTHTTYIYICSHKMCIYLFVHRFYKFNGQFISHNVLNASNSQTLCSSNMVFSPVCCLNAGWGNICYFFYFIFFFVVCIFTEFFPLQFRVV